MDKIFHSILSLKYLYFVFIGWFYSFLIPENILHQGKYFGRLHWFYSFLIHENISHYQNIFGLCVEFYSFLILGEIILLFENIFHMVNGSILSFCTVPFFPYIRQKYFILLKYFWSLCIVLFFPYIR